MRSLNLDKLKNKKKKDMSSKEGLKDVEPINWSSDVLDGKKKVIVESIKKSR